MIWKKTTTTISLIAVMILPVGSSFGSEQNPPVSDLPIGPITITPMLSTLSLMEYADSESSVLGIGMSLIILNGLMYVGIPAVAIIGIRRCVVSLV